MSPQEIQVLQNFLDQLVKVQDSNKDAQALAMINEAVSKQPDAHYLLVQRALLLDQALSNANQQIASLQTQLRDVQAQRNPAPAGNFLDPATTGWGNSASSRAQPAASYSVSGQALPPPLPASYMNAAAPVAAPASGFFGGGAGNVLGTVAATAAGVAAGAFLFQGIGHLMGGQHHAASTDNAAAQLNQGGGDLIPGYFDTGNTSNPSNTSATNSNTDSTAHASPLADATPSESAFADDNYFDGDDLDLA
ncbi:DUF2076 domain-containing protein [Undibacterium sp. TC9W]|uniref:DUF2076 domain-containing protein n=1 Tax=Undibacterium sp. TC9W TaxID=3413053 RepID=UPI003BEF8934